MREIIFEEVHMENFGPYIDPMELQFISNSLTLMSGPNGIGKTMSLDAIPFTFFNMTTKKLKGDECVNNVVGKNCKTWVKFKIDQDQYICTRYQKYKNIGSTAILNKNGVDIKKGKEVSEEIERLICPQKAFMNTLMFGQKTRDFFTDITDGDKKEIFRKILNLEKYITYYKKSDEKLKEVKKLLDKIQTNITINGELSKETSSQIEEAQENKKQFYENKNKNLEELNTKLKLYVDTIDTLQFELKNINTDDEDEINSQLLKIQTDLDNLTNKYDVLKQNVIDQLQNKTNELGQKESEAKFQVTQKYESKINELKEKQTNILNTKHDLSTKLQNTRHHFDLQISNASNQIQNYETDINKIFESVFKNDISSCPTCRQEVTEEIKEQLRKQIEENKKQIKLLEESIENIKNENIKGESYIDNKFSQVYIEENEIKNKLNDVMQERSRELLELSIKLGNAILKANELKQEMIIKLDEDYKNENKNLVEQQLKLKNKKNEINDLKFKKTTIENKLTELEKGKAVTENMIDSANKQEYDDNIIKNLQEKQINIQNKINTLINETSQHNEKVEIYEFWKSAFSSTGIPSMLIDEAIPFMNEKIKHYLDLISNGRYIVSFDTLSETKAGEFRDKISVRVLDTYTQANTRLQLSGGQTRLVDIATILTLGDLYAIINNLKINILIFDEIFDALDDENISYVSRVFNKLKENRSIYIISHQHQEHLEADETLKFT